MMSTICEPQTSRAWYLGHSAWLIDTGLQLFLFDYGRVPSRPSRGLPGSGVFDPATIGDRPFTAFFSHQHGDHYHSGLHQQIATMEGTQVVVGLDKRQNGHGLPTRQTVVMRPHDQAAVGNLTIHASSSTDSGVSFLIIAPEMTIYHGGDLAAWDDTVWFRETYSQEIGWLANKLAESGRTIDVAMLPVSTSDGYQEDALLEGLDEALEKLQPRQVLPMHALGFESLYDSYIERESAKQNPIRVHRPVMQPGGLLLI